MSKINISKSPIKYPKIFFKNNEDNEENQNNLNEFFKEVIKGGFITKINNYYYKGNKYIEIKLYEDINESLFNTITTKILKVINFTPDKIQYKGNKDNFIFIPDTIKTEISNAKELLKNL